MAFVKLIVVGFAVLSLAYWTVSVYSRSVRRERLERRWDETHPGGRDAPARARFVERGLHAYEGSLRKRLILLVYVIPVALVVAIHILTTYG